MRRVWGLPLNCRSAVVQILSDALPFFDVSGSVWAALLLSCETGCSLYLYTYTCIMLVRLSVCLDHIKGTIIIIFTLGCIVPKD